MTISSHHISQDEQSVFSLKFISSTSTLFPHDADRYFLVFTKIYHPPQRSIIYWRVIIGGLIFIQNLLCSGVISYLKLNI